MRGVDTGLSTLTDVWISLSQSDHLTSENDRRK